MNVRSTFPFADHVTRSVVSKSPDARAAVITASLGLVFLLVAVGEGVLFCPGEPRQGYLLNLSWSVAMIVLFPIVINAIVLFHRHDVPSLLAWIDEDGSSVGRSRAAELRAQLTGRFGAILFWVILGLAVLLIWKLYFADPASKNSWLWAACRQGDATSLFAAVSRSTWLAKLTAIVQFLLAPLLVMYLYQAIVLARGMATIVFSDPDFSKRLHPLHPDGVYGLGALRRIIVRWITVMIALGLYVFLYIVDRFSIQIIPTGGPTQQHLTVLLLYVVLYGIFLGTFVYWFVPPHRQMESAKQRVLEPEVAAYMARVAKAAHSSPSDQDREHLRKLRADVLELSRATTWPLGGPRTAASWLGGVATSLLVGPVFSLITELMKPRAG